MAETPHRGDDEHPHVIAKNARLGLVLFVLYVLLYGGFVALSAFWPNVMSRDVGGGVNLAIAYGLGLIVAAFVLALIYMALTSRRSPGDDEGEDRA